MKRLKSIVFIISLGILSCTSNAQQPDNTIPMYGNVVKDDDHKKIDEDFINHSIKQFGTIDSASKAYADFAWRYFYNNDLKTAMKRFNQAWLLNSEYPDVYFGFAALLDMQGNKPESQKMYQLGLAKDKAKNRAEICYQRIADCKEQLKDLDGTLEAYEKILQLKPNNMFALKKTAYFHMEKGNYEPALKAYNKAIELDPKDAVTYNNRGYLYQTAKKYSHAISDYNKAIEIDSKYISAYVNKGILEMEEKKFEAAKKDFEISVRLDNKAPELRRFLGLAKLSLNDRSGACEDFKEAKKMGDTGVDELMVQNCK